MLTTWRQICDQGLTPTRLQRPVSSPDSSGYPSTFVPLGCKFSHNLVPHPLARFGHKGLLINSKRDSYYSGNLKSINSRKILRYYLVREGVESSLHRLKKKTGPNRTNDSATHTPSIQLESDPTFYPAHWEGAGLSLKQG